MKRRVLNYRFAKPDPRDCKYSQKKQLVEIVEQALPPKVDLRPKCPDVYDQGDQGSCTGNAAAFTKQFLNMMYGIDWLPARDFVYKNELIMQGTPNEDAGSDLRTSMQALLQYGACHEELYPYSPNIFKTAPSKAAYDDGAQHKIGAFYLIDGEYSLRHCLADGFPAVCGIIVPQQMMDDNFDGFIRDLKPDDALLEDGQTAGHAVSIVGYEDDYFWFRNSWGKDWGPFGGYWKMHQDVVTDPDWVSDFYSPRLAHQPGL